MKVAVIYNKPQITEDDVINLFGMRTKETYNPRTVERVAAALEKGGHNVKKIEGNMNVVEALQNFMPRVVSGERPGIVFNMAYGIQGESRYTHIPALLEMLGVPYVGSGPAGHALALDKVMAKLAFQGHGLPTPDFWVLSRKEVPPDIRYPVIVKPKMEAVSFGLRIVYEDAALEEAVEHIITEFQQQALVEIFIPGREFAVGLLGNGPTLETLPIVEIDLEGDPNAIQSVEDKMAKPRKKICPADLPAEKAEEMRRLAKEAFNALGLLDFARVDFRMDETGNLYILEINSMASLGTTGSYVYAAEKAGWNYDALVNRMLDVAAIRYWGEVERLLEEGEGKSKRSYPLPVRLRSYLRSHATTMEEDIERMVSIHTFVHNVDSVNQLGNLLSLRFQSFGFHRQVFPQTEVGNILYFSNHHEEQNDILILGHLDTRADSQSYTPFHQDRGRLYGTGVAESKGGLALLLAALQALRFARVIKRCRIGVLLTTDDTLSGKFSRDLVKNFAELSACVVHTKYGDLNGGIVVSCSGSRHYRIEFTNIKRNGPETKSPLIPVVCQKVLSWQKLSSPESGIDVTIQSLEAHTGLGHRSDHAAVELTLRFDAKEQGKELDRKIRKITEKERGEDLQIQIKRGARRLPSPPSEVKEHFFERVRKIAKRHEIRVEGIHRRHSSDICHVPEGIPVLDGFGPLGAQTRSADEYILRDSLIDRALLLALVIEDAARGRRE